MKASVGRIVHVGRIGHDVCPAIVTGIYPDRGNIDVTLFPRSGLPVFLENVPENEHPYEDGAQHAGQGWFWPPRESA